MPINLANKTFAPNLLVSPVHDIDIAQISEPGKKLTHVCDVC